MTGKAWTKEEADTVACLFPEGGSVAVQSVLTHRNANEIRGFASRNNIVFSKRVITEDMHAEMEALYRQGGSRAVRARWPYLGKETVGSWASRRGLRAPVEINKPKEFGTPTQTLTDQLACVRLRKWRGPVMPGPLVATIGRVA